MALAPTHQKAHDAPYAPPRVSRFTCHASPACSLSAWRRRAMQPGGVSANDTRGASNEQRAEGVGAVDAPNSLPKDLGDRQRRDLSALERIFAQRNRVGDDDFLDVRRLDSLDCGPRLSTMASVTPRRLAKARARSTPPASGLTTTTSSGREPYLRFMSSRRMGEAYRWSEGMSKKPWICPACRSMETKRSAPAEVMRSATRRAVIGVLGATLRSWRA